NGAWEKEAKVGAGSGAGADRPENSQGGRTGGVGVLGDQSCVAIQIPIGAVESADEKDPVADIAWGNGEDGAVVAAAAVKGPEVIISDILLAVAFPVLGIADAQVILIVESGWVVALDNDGGGIADTQCGGFDPCGQGEFGLPPSAVGIEHEGTKGTAIKDRFVAGAQTGHAGLIVQRTERIEAIESERTAV